MTRAELLTLARPLIDAFVERLADLLLAQHARTCDQCSRPLERKRHRDGRLERNGDFARRRFCDVACSSAWRRAHPELFVTTPPRPAPSRPTCGRARGSQEGPLVPRSRDRGARGLAQHPNAGVAQ